jgi:hypothetical protein
MAFLAYACMMSKFGATHESVVFQWFENCFVGNATDRMAASHEFGA